MSKLQVFEPAMCCSTGGCGPAVDPVLPLFAANLEWLKSKGAQVERYNLAQQVADFTANALVKQALNSKGKVPSNGSDRWRTEIGEQLSHPRTVGGVRFDSV